ncbi:cytochrome P450 [Streptomyces sp. NPDC006654]|uniref:cytochrome P450 n=1 Tax=Streptomyces sp. NPDC006654 TaxID=3156897 RepID=UPI0033C26594
MSSSAVVPTARGALPLVGHAPALLRDALGFFSALPALGDLVRIRLGSQSMVLVCSPELTWKLLQDDRTFDKGGHVMDRVREIGGDGLASCPHSQHRRQRRLCQPSFHASRYAGYSTVMAAEAEAAAAQLRHGQTADVHRHVMRYASQAGVRAMFSTGVPDEYMELFPGDVATVLEGIVVRAVLPPVLTRLPTPGNRRYFQARSRTRQTVSRIIAQHRASGTDHGDLLSSLLAATDTESDDGSRTLSDSEALDQVVTFLLAGTETTATTVSWALHLLAQNPQIQRRVREQIDTVLRGAAPSHDDLPRLELIDHVITETLRLYPAAWLNTRITTRDTRLGDFDLPQGTSLVYSPYVIHHRSDVYDDPELFLPDRWHGVRPDRTTYLPFGGGARKCIGDRFAWTEIALFLATLLSRWEFSPADDRPVVPAVGLSLTPKNLRLRVTRRTAPDC